MKIPGIRWKYNVRDLSDPSGAVIIVSAFFYRHMTPPESGSWFGLKFTTPAGSYVYRMDIARRILDPGGVACFNDRLLLWDFVSRSL